MWWPCPHWALEAAPAAAPAARGDYSGMSKVGAVEAKPTKKPEKAPEEAASGFNPLILVLLLSRDL